MILSIATYCERRPDGLSMRDVIRMLLLAAVPIFLVFIQPDLGTAIIMVVILVVMLAIAGVPPRFLVLLGILAAGAAAIAIVLGVLQHYQVVRLTSFLGTTPYQVQEAKDAIGAGGFWGQGFFHGQLVTLGYVPEDQTDFIFTAVGEQLGFVGALGLIVALAAVAGRMLRSSMHARGPPRPPARRRGLHLLRVQLLPECGHDHGPHAGDRDPTAVHELRRLGRGVLLPGGRHRAVGHQPKTRDGNLVSDVDDGSGDVAGDDPAPPDAPDPHALVARRSRAARGGAADRDGDEAHATFVLVEVVNVVFHLPQPSPVLHLRETEPPYRAVHFPIGLPEAQAIALALERRALRAPVDRRTARRGAGGDGQRRGRGAAHRDAGTARCSPSSTS